MQMHIQQDEVSWCSPLEAWQQGQLTLSFSGGGFLLPYHLGVYQSLAAMGLVSTTTPMAGASAGSLVVSGIKSGLTLQQQMDSFMEAAHSCREQGVNGRLRKVLKAQLNKSMPDDAAERCSDGSCWVSVTQVFPRPANKLYGGFSSRQQLIKALLASCHLPRLSDGGLFTSYKSPHKRVFDGGFSNLCPVPPVPRTGTQALYTHTSSKAAPAEATALAAVSGSAGAGSATSKSTMSQGVSSRDAREDSGVGSCTEPHPTAPAAALLHLNRSDSTKGITTKLLPSKSKSRTAHTSTTSSSSSRVYSRSISAPADPSSSTLHGLHDSNCSSSTGHGHNSSSSSHVAHRGVRLPSMLLRGHRQQQRQQAAEAEQQLVASCEVAGPGAYVAPEAQGWFAVRVCVLPSRHMAEFPTMFRAPAAEGVAIALDKFQEWPHDLDATTKLALYPQDDDFLWGLFERGQQDGISWAQQQGFPPEVLQRVAQGAAEVEELRVRRMSAREPTQQQQQRGDGLMKQLQQEAAAVIAAAEGMQEVQQEYIPAAESSARQ